MQTNALPHQDLSDRPTGCCPRFDPAGWDGVELHFRDKRFIRAETRSAMHLPLNMSKVFGRVHAHIEAAGGYDPDNTIVLSRDLSPWKAEHLFATEGDVPDEDATTLSGDFVTKVFDGPYNEAKSWYGEMETWYAPRARNRRGSISTTRPAPDAPRRWGTTTSSASPKSEETEPCRAILTPRSSKSWTGSPT
jgi:hypothetical protein